MDLTNVKPVDDAQLPREASQQRSTPAVERSAAAGVEAPGVAPQAGGALASANVDNGTSRDAAADQLTQDRIAALQEKLNEISHRRNLPADRELTIEVDAESLETRFLVRDRESGEVIRRIPDKELRELLAEAAREGVAGIIDQRI